MIESPRLSDYPVDPEASSRYSRFDQLNPQWWERVAAAVAAGSVEVSGLKIDRGRGELEMPWFNRRLVLVPARKNIFFRDDHSCRPTWQEGLVALALLDYLFDHHRLPPPAGLVSEQHLTGGTTFFRGPHVMAAVRIAEEFADNGAGLLARGREWGGVEAACGEYAVKFTIFPGLEWIVALWEADDEFPARAVYLFDQNLEKIFQLDLIWALGNVVAARLLPLAD